MAYKDSFATGRHFKNEKNTIQRLLSKSYNERNRFIIIVVVYYIEKQGTQDAN